MRPGTGSRTPADDALGMYADKIRPHPGDCLARTQDLVRDSLGIWQTPGKEFTGTVGCSGQGLVRVFRQQGRLAPG